MPRQRDSQRQKVYHGEWTWSRSKEWKTLTLREMQKKVNQMMSTQAWYQYSSSRYPILVRLTRSDAYTSRADNNARLISIAPGHEMLPVLIHEVAHIIVMRSRGAQPASHGPEFMWIYRMLAEEMFTKAQFEGWEASMLKYGVRWDREAAERRRRPMILQ